MTIESPGGGLRGANSDLCLVWWLHGHGHCTRTAGAWMQVRTAYRKRGWAFTDPQGIEQCAKEGYITKLKEQEGEGCHMWGQVLINKVLRPAWP